MGVSENSVPTSSKKKTDMKEKHIHSGKAAAVYLVIVFVVSAFLWGYFLGTRGNNGKNVSASGTYEIAHADRDDSGNEIDFEQFWDLWKVVQERHVSSPVDEKEMFYGAMAGMVASLNDPYSVFLDPPTTDEFTTELSGKFEGIGAEIGIKNDQLTIIAPLPDSPAERGGLFAGDQILAVDGLDTRFMSLDRAVSHIRGDKGTVVRLLVMREGFDVPKEIPITRDTIRIISVKSSFGSECCQSPKGKKLAIIKVTHYNGDTLERFQEAVTELQSKDIDGVILDLRNNPGGFLNAAIRMLGEWLPGEVVVSEKFSDGTREDSVSSGRGRLSGIETVVLVNGGSASASEITAGALQDYGKAVIIGTQTFGKGSVQDLVSFDDGSSVKLTIAEWLTPEGRNINKDGIAPDYIVERSTEDYDNDLDPQLDAAKAYFDGVIPPEPEEDDGEETQ